MRMLITILAMQIAFLNKGNIENYSDQKMDSEIIPNYKQMLKNKEKDKIFFILDSCINEKNLEEVNLLKQKIANYIG